MTNIIFILIWCGIPFVPVSHQYLERCKMTTDCPERAHCNMNRSVCFCNTNFVPIPAIGHLSCLPVSEELGGKCENDIQCQAGLGKMASCKQGVCNCTGRAHFAAGVCYSSALIGDPCNVTNECVVRHRGIMAYCDIHESGVCICPPRHHMSFDRADCLPDTALGDPCMKDEDCFRGYAECKRVCVCKPNFTRSLNKTTCLPVVKKLGDKCLENRQCSTRVPNSRCYSGNSTCICQDVARLVNNTCIISVPLGGYCQGPDDCLIRSKNISRVECRSGICRCRKKFRPWRDDCVISAAAGKMENQQLIASVVISYLASLLIGSYIFY